MTLHKGLGEVPAWVSAPDPSIYWGDNYVTVDFETTTESKGSPLIERNRLVLACWKYKGITHHTFGGEYEQAALVEHIAAADFLVAHNAKFELGWLKRCGVDLRGVICFDTMIAEHVLGGNTFFPQQLSLKLCLERRGLLPKMDLCGMMFGAGFCSTDIPQSWLLEYCMRDVQATELLFLSERQELQDKRLEAVNYQRNLVTPCLADIEFNGVQLDEKQVEKLIVEMEDEYARTTSSLQEFCEGAEPASSKQLKGFVFNTLGFKVPRDNKGRPMLTPGGDPSLSADVLERLKPTNSRQREFLDKYNVWKSLHSDVTKYLRKFRDCCRDSGGAIRAVFNQCATRTHRFSSSGLEYKVQFQNFNRKFKPLFRARKAGWKVGEADGAQLEFRIGTHLGRDKVALNDIYTGRDIHSYTASILGISRTEAKRHTFKPMYGGISGTPKEQEYYASFAERYKGISQTQRSWALKVLDTKELRTEWGMVFYWPTTQLRPSGWITNQTNIYNYPIQCFATAEIIPCALVCAWHRMAGMKSFIVNTVHDSIIAELHPDEIEVWHEIAKQCLIHDSYKMIYDLYGVRLTVPLGAGVTVGTHWASDEAKEGEVVYEAPDELWMPAAQEEGMI